METQARLNRSERCYSAGTRVVILTDPKSYDHPNFHGFDHVRLASPPYTVFDIECDALTECRPMVDEVPSENRHKRRAKFQNPIDATGVGGISGT